VIRVSAMKKCIERNNRHVQSQPRHQREASGKYHIPTTLSREKGITSLCGVLGPNDSPKNTSKIKMFALKRNRPLSIYNLTSHFSD
jgi:hypothetical protein